MKKVLFFFFIFFNLLSINNNLYSKNKISKDFLGCSNNLTKEFFNYENIAIKKIEIDINNYRNWVTNNIKIITSNTRFIENKYKKKYKGTIKVIYETGDFCIFPGRIRHSGDAKDHIALKGNSIIQSLDVSLDAGSIKGITKFKLFKPDVRGVLNDVVLQTELLRELGYLAPRSAKIMARVNETESVMLFQEKAAKELLEFNNRREGPILEGDQKYFFKLVQDIPDNELSNWSVGTPFLRNKSMKVMLTKSTNSRIVNRSQIHKRIYLKAVNNLNLIYLYWANRFQDGENNFFFDYDLDNELLGLLNKKNIIKLDKYNILMQATNSHHALSVSNRKFYWNAIENYYEPINYDANPDINRDTPTTTNSKFRFPISKYYGISINELKKDINRIDSQKLLKKISVNGLNYTTNELDKKLEKILSNLERINKNYLSLDENLVSFNRFKPIENLLSRFNNTLKDIDPNAYLITFNEKGDELLRCKVFLKECKNINLSDDELSLLLEGELNLDNTIYQYLGQNFNLSSLSSKNVNFNQLELDDTSIFFEKGIDVKIEKESKTIFVKQTRAGAKIYFINGKLNNFNIKYEGKKIIDINQDFNLLEFPKDFPINSSSLTGCISFINLEVEKLKIDANNSSCEDTINFINSIGHVEHVNILNSFSDALDVDFSRINFDNITIENALNDCVDFSSGNYILKKLNLKNCGDKGLSIGEKSTIKLGDIQIKNANMGVATKDSSVLSLINAEINDVKTCVSAYNKKQEYLGGYIELKNLNCKNYLKKAELDSLSKIILNKKDLSNNLYGKSYNYSDYNISNVNGEKIIGHLIKDYKAENKDGTFNVVVEISLGLKEKWEISKVSGSLSREFYMGSPRIINYEPYPANYGMIPQTILPISRGGDGDPLDVIILGKGIPQGSLIKAKALGIIKMKDSGEQDDKIIAVKANSPLSKYNNLEHLNSENPEILNKLKDWFLNYKGQNVVQFINFESEDKAKILIKEATRYYKRFGLKERS
tara:strand:+ start:7972 stop:10977 length:3006 start_codon:yes stop_codon:yes gene_type:complete